MRLTKDDVKLLKVAAHHGSVRVTSKAKLDRAIVLAAHGLLSENDNAPGVYEITPEGERALNEELEDV